MKALIIAGGKSARMHLKDQSNKCLLDVGGMSILERSIRALKRHDINEIYVVTGHQREEMEKVVGDSAKCVFNSEYETKGINTGIEVAKEFLYGKKFFLITGDLLYDSHMLDRCSETQGEIVVSFEKKDKYTEEDSKLMVENGFVTRMGKDLPLDTTSGEFGHMMKFSEKGSEMLFDAIQELHAGGHWHAYIMDAINLIIEKEIPIHAADVTGLPRIEVDFVEDLEEAREVIFPRIEKEDV